ncbi:MULTISPECIES: OmpP1/FadL family transporter [Thiomicrorhabdus]|uniref:Outer membrane protein transport protein n=1 Tax=Thiomicrorhabdus heinhorstiae TaxID=2748010 RepID=A0ABS0BZB8_9GAMM|nr:MULTISPECIES: outer membrane protein transport protein [Thiomicrorhabdus]MBF6058191.1 outer membrane protein transport protein [Thiomicrorhabdus heinhorstiae]
MRKTKLALALSFAAAGVFSTNAMATNGTNMIAVGAQSAATGGTGVAGYFGAENVIINPALIGKGDGTEFTFGGTLFAPDVKTKNNTVSSVFQAFGFTADDASGNSKADLFVVPSVSFATRINQTMSFGIGMFGTSGMGVDYRTNDGLFNAQSQLQIMRFVPTLTFNSRDRKMAVGISPILQYGALDINYRTNDNAIAEAQGNVTADGNETQHGSGMATDLGVGYTIGTYFDLGKNLTFGLAYQSPISMKYNGQLSTAGQGFNLVFGDELEQPAEIKAGVSYGTKRFMVNADVKQVQWGEAAGYKDYGWENQMVYALGMKLMGKNSWIGFGYNYGKNPIKEQAAASYTTDYKGAATNMFNNTFFPATVEEHFTIGGGFNISKNASLEGAFVYTPKVKTTVDTSAVSQAFAYDGAIAQGMGPGTADGLASGVKSSSTTEHSQMGLTMQMKYHF